MDGFLVGGVPLVGKCGAQAQSVAIGITVTIVSGVNGDLLALMPEPPATLIRSLVKCNAVQPGAQTGIAMETANAANNLDKDFLSQIRSVGWILDAASNEGVKRLMIL